MGDVYLIWASRRINTVLLVQLQVVILVRLIMHHGVVFDHQIVDLRIFLCVQHTAVAPLTLVRQDLNHLLQRAFLKRF